MNLRQRIGTSVLLVMNLLPAAWALAQEPATMPATARLVPTSQQVSYESAIKVRNDQPDERFLKAHALFLERIKRGPIGVLFIGDSITAGWPRNRELYTRSFGEYAPATFAISGDRTQHVLWRLSNGELDISASPKVIVLMVGTNNVRTNSPDDIARGVEAIVKLVREKHPSTKVLLLGLLPMGVDPTDPQVAATRQKVTQVNQKLSALDSDEAIVFMDMGSKFLTEDGKTSDAMRADGVHLEVKGYEIWAQSIGPVLAEMMK